MSQSWTDNVYQSDHVYSTDLQNMENNFAALKSMFSGSAAPSSPIAGMPWFDTAQKVQKQYNAGATAWIGLMHGDVSEKRLVYRDAAMDGYARDSGVTDRVIALKGGTIYTTGAATAGSWIMAGFTKDAHTHPIAHIHNFAVYDVYGSRSFLGELGYQSGSDVLAAYTSGGSTIISRIYRYTAASSAANSGAQSDSGITHDGADRLAAAVCILVYLDL